MVTVPLKKTLCVLGLGSNRPFKTLSCGEILSSAAAELQKSFGEFRLSPLYKTAPLHVTEQPYFYNAAGAGYFIAETADIAGARKLLHLIHMIEKQYGRDRSQEKRWGERSLDIDILLFGDVVTAENDLIIPHPRLKERAFALRPLLDLLPDAVDPATGERYSEILAALPWQEIDRI